MHTRGFAPTGEVKAAVFARELEVLGSIEGKVEAVDKVYIRKGARFIGDVHSAGIIIEDGGFITGNIDLSRQPEPASMPARSDAALNGSDIQAIHARPAM